MTHRVFQSASRFTFKETCHIWTRFVWCPGLQGEARLYPTLHYANNDLITTNRWFIKVVRTGYFNQRPALAKHCSQLIISCIRNLLVKGVIHALGRSDTSKGCYLPVSLVLKNIKSDMCMIIDLKFLIKYYLVGPPKFQFESIKNRRTHGLISFNFFMSHHNPSKLSQYFRLFPLITSSICTSTSSQAFIEHRRLSLCSSESSSNFIKITVFWYSCCFTLDSWFIPPSQRQRSEEGWGQRRRQIPTWPKCFPRLFPLHLEEPELPHHPLCQPRSHILYSSIHNLNLHALNFTLHNRSLYY